MGKNCTRLDFRGEWTGALWFAEHVTWYGRQEITDAAVLRDRAALIGLGPGGAHRPAESSRDGCQGGWVRCRFVESFLQYRRQRTREGGRVDNPNLAGVKDPLILEALAYYEWQEASAYARYEEAAYS